MPKINKHIEIVRSTNMALSSMSQESCDAIVATLSKNYAKVGVTVVNDLSGLEKLLFSRPDLVFLGMEFIPEIPLGDLIDCEKIWITDYLDENGIAYTGSNQLAHKLGRNKALAKQCVLDAGLSTSAFCVVEQGLPMSSELGLTFPLFIKPTNRGGGVGVDSNSVAHNTAQLNSKVFSISTDYQADALVEEYLSGREFSVAILKDEFSDNFSVMPIELIAPTDKNGDRILGQEVKTANTEQAIGVKDQIVKSKVVELALDVFHALGGQDYGRIDIRLDKDGIPHFLEANLIPSLISGYGSFPKACLINIGLDFESMIARIVNLGLGRASSIENLDEFDPIFPISIPLTV